MIAERWAQVDRILQAALAVAQERREEFIRSTCNGDHALRLEVESLLAAHLDAGAFLELSALELEGAATASDSHIETGQEIGPYRILSKLGDGGMGDVYRAHDSRLERDVAVKLLAGEFDDDGARIQQVFGEAKAASALNHPNVLTIYETGQYHGTPFIVTDLVEGQTLRSAISTMALPLMTVLDVAVQIAAGLGAAHATGIVHSDIKPENVIIRPDGLVKILDFGLAHRSDGAVSGLARERAAVAGTAPYMCPSRFAANLSTHGRICSAPGCCSTRCAPGRRRLRAPPRVRSSVRFWRTSPSRFATQHQAFLRKSSESSRKTLAKNRERRYRTAEELLSDLEQLKRRLEISRDAAPVTRAAVALFVTVLIIAGVSLAPQTPAMESASAVPRLIPVTSHGRVVTAAISPDGRYVAYASEENAGQSLWLKEVALSTETQIAPPRNVSHKDLTFSRDGRSLYYVGSDSNLTGADSALYRKELGGSPRNESIAPAGGFALSPDGRRFGIVRRDRETLDTQMRAVGNTSNLWMQPVDGSPPYPVTAFSAEGISTFDWSRDGRLVFSRATTNRNIVLITGFR